MKLQSFIERSFYKKKINVRKISKTCSQPDNQTNSNFNQKQTQKQASSKKDKPSRLKTVVFGVTPYDKREAMRIRFKGLIDYLSEQLQVNIIFTVALNYDRLAMNLNNNKINFALISPTAYVKVKQQYPKLKYVATTIKKKTGKEYYYGYIFTRRDSKITSYKNLKQKFFAFVDEGSGSGFNFPVALMIKKWHIDPKQYFKKTLFLGNHPNVIEAVFKKQAHAGATWMWPYEEKAAQYGKDPFNILLKTPPIPSDAFTVCPNTDDNTIKKIQSLLLAINEQTKTTKGLNVT